MYTQIEQELYYVPPMRIPDLIAVWTNTENPLLETWCAFH